MARENEIPLGDVLKLRSGLVQEITPKLNVFPPLVAGTATVAAMPISFPTTEIEISGLSADFLTEVRPGQMVRISSPSGATRTWGVVRLAPDASTFYIDQKKAGDPGLSEFIEDAVQIGDTLTVYYHEPPWILLSRIANLNVTQGTADYYKMWDVAYVDQNSNPPPVANTGPWQAGFSDETFTFPRYGYNTSFSFENYPVSYSWDIGPGALLHGYTLGNGVIKVQFPPGVWEVRLTVTAKTGKTHTAVCRVFVEDRNNPTSFGDQYQWEISGGEYPPIGRFMEFTVWGDGLDANHFLPNSAILYTERTRIGGSTLSEGTLVDTFVGYVTEATWSHTGQVPSVKLKAMGPGQLWPNMNMPSQVLTEVIPAATWTQCTAILSNPIGALAYLLRWHAPVFLDMHDLDVGQYDPAVGVDLYNSPLRDLRRLSYGFPSGVLASQLNSILADRGSVGSYSDGSIVMRLHPWLEDNDFRNALPVGYDLSPDDLAEAFTYQQAIQPAIAHTVGAAKRYIGGGASGWSDFAAIKSGGQGRAEDKMADSTIRYDEGAEKIQALVGHRFTFRNSPTPEFEQPLMGNLDVFDPPAQIWTGLNIPPEYDPRGVGFDGTRAVCTKVSYQYTKRPAGMVKKVTATFQPETFGQPGEPYDRGAGEGSSGVDSGWIVSAPVAFAPTDTSEELNLAVAWNDAGQIARTFGFAMSNIEFTDMSGRFSGLVNWAQWDWWSQYFTHGRDSTRPIGLFVVTTEDTTLRIYYVGDVRAKKWDVTLLHTETMGDNAVGVWAMVDVSRSESNFVGVCYRQQDGVYTLRSTDGGAAWAGPTLIGSSASDTTHDGEPMGYAIDGEIQIATGWNGSTYSIHIATSKTGAFSDSGLVSAAEPHRTIISSFDGYAYAARATKSSTTTSVNVAGGDDEAFYVNRVDPLQRAASPSGYTVASDGPQYIIEYDTAIRPAFMQLRVRTVLNSGVFTDENAIQATGLQHTLVLRCINGSSSFPPTDQVSYYAEYKFDNASPLVISGSDTDFSASNPRIITNPLGGGQYEHTWVLDALASEDFTDKKLSEYTLEISFTQTAAPNVETWQLQLDAIRFDVGQASYASGLLYRLAALSGTPTATNVTPAAGKVPARPLGLSANLVDPTELIMLGVSSAVFNRFIGAGRGTGWAQDTGVSRYRGALWTGNLYILFGLGALAISADGLQSVIDRLGNLGAIWGGVGEIKGVRAIIEG